MKLTKENTTNHFQDNEKHPLNHKLGTIVKDPIRPEEKST